MALVNVGGSVFVDEAKVDFEKLPPKDWFPGMADLAVYPYAKFPSLERVEWGLALTEGRPTDKWLDWQKVGDDRFNEPVAPLIDIKDAQRLLDLGRQGALEENPFAELQDEDDYLELLATQMREGIRGIETWPADKLERVRDESKWMGPGVYDLRDMTRHKESVEEYEREGMAFWADHIVDEMFYDDKWVQELKDLLFRNR
jgi:hypothetical protein